MDVLRGIAILGTLATNIGIFTSVITDQTVVPRWLDLGLSTAIGLVTDGKWIGLLTIMFGIGLEIQRQSAVRRGDPWLGTYPWRAILLILDGLLNYIFIFEFDVLMGYGLTGLVMCAVFATTPRAQKWFMAIGLVVHVAYLTHLSGLLQRVPPYSDAMLKLFDKDPSTLSPQQLAKAAKASELSPAEYIRQWHEAGADMVTTPATYWDEVTSRWDSFWTGGRGEIPIMFTMGMGLFLVGAFLYRAGIFNADGARLRRRVMLLSFGIALPIDWVTRIWFSAYTGTFNRYLTSACVSIGVLALVAHFYAGGRLPGRVGRWVSYVGKMALSCYLAMNLIASLLFKPWALDLNRFMEFGVFNDVIGFVVVGAILIGFATLWLRRFDRGPVEYLWHVMHQWLVEHTTVPLLKWRADRRSTQLVSG